jgi:hypothetical protein
MCILDPAVTHPSASQVRWGLLQDRRLRQLLILAACVALGAAMVAFPVLHSAVASDQHTNARTAASYTGWVATNSPTPLALSVEPCRHAPCDNIAIDLTVVNALGTRQVPCVLGGVLTNDGRGFDVYALCPGNIPVRATFTGTAPIIGTTTDGTGTLQLQYGVTYATYHLRSATMGEQDAIFAGH